ncbi:Ig-like domain-containing protein, partial [Salmonella enterica]|uniref:Ig-like domain-containing protein n=1 Tax=Salmonella enterica TaxID=28901 RepID=UPI001F411E61
MSYSYSLTYDLTRDPAESTNRAPVANPDSATTTVNSPVSVSVLANDSDPDGDALGVKQCSQPVGSAVSVANDIVTVAPPRDFSGRL